MPKLRKEIELSIWTRFRAYNFAIAPSLAGACHNLEIDGLPVRISLPKRPKKKNWNDEFGDITCNSWRSRGERDYPIEFNVHDISIALDTGQKLSVRPESIGRVNVSLFNKAERQRYNRLFEKFGPKLNSAFDRWVDTIRWASGISMICQTTDKLQRQSYANYMVDKNSNKRFYAVSQTMVVTLQSAVTKRDWNRAQDALSRNFEVPIWWHYYASAAHNSKINHNRECIIELAIALETIVRVLMGQFVNEPKNKCFEDKVGRIGINNIISDWRKLGFDNKAWERMKPDINLIGKVFDKRNRIMHRGILEPLSMNDKNRYLDAARNFITLGEKSIR